MKPGTKLGPYEVIAPLGEGGMGEVYRARDPQLKRDVALKILPTELALDPERLARFDREAQALAALNHPNIAQVYGFVHDADVRAIVMELVEGPTLAERIARGTVPLDEALPLAIQLADALEYAHERGIVHRDLKPANIKLTTDGAVKVLDFGLAKALAPAGASATADLTDSPTVTSPAAMTRVGVILGTAAYMAPEQARGEVVDKRADIWAFGVVLFEMLTGKTCFAGETLTDVLAAVVATEPDWKALPATVSWRLRELLQRCLTKDRKQRLHDIGDARLELQHVAPAAPEPSTAAPALAPRRLAWTIALAAVALAAVASVFFVYGRRSVGGPQPLKFTRLTFEHLNILNARFTPDGRVVYSARVPGQPPDVLDTDADSRAVPRPRNLVGAVLLSVASDGDLAVRTRAGLFGVMLTEPGPLATVSRSGSAPHEELDEVWCADYSRQNKVLAVVRNLEGRYRLEMPAGTELAATSGQFANVRVSPDGRRIALTHHAVTGDARGTVEVVEVSSRAKTTVAGGYANVEGLAWSPDGREIWFSAARAGNRQSLYAVTPGRPVRLLAELPGSVILHDVAADGRVLLASGTRTAGIRGVVADSRERELAWLDFSWPRALSADGSRLLLDDMGDSGGRYYTVYLASMDGSRPVRLGEGDGYGLSKDGRWATALRDDRPPSLLLLPTQATSTGKPILLPSLGIERYQAPAFLPDGRVLFLGARQGRPFRAWVQDTSGGPPQPVTQEGAIRPGIVPGPLTTSPDGRWLAAVTGDHELMIFPLDGGQPIALHNVGPKEMVCQWSEDSSTIYTYRQGAPLEVFAIDAKSRLRRLWRSFTPPETGGVALSFVMTRDTRSYAYGYERRHHELYVAEGLR